MLTRVEPAAQRRIGLAEIFALKFNKLRRLISINNNTVYVSASHVVDDGVEELKKRRRTASRRW